mmetsp:Transcript_12216/g.18741  ORF Transcript_12216/g.18741 Transcript_12216/m.18741 type:complete len:352 (-) Transcript_12216:42-1097(-)
MDRKSRSFVLIGLIGFVLVFSHLKQGRIHRNLRIIDPKTISEKTDLGQAMTKILDEPTSEKQPIVSESKPTTFLLGIFSTPWEAHRRKRIRETMVNANYLQSDICSLSEYLKHQTRDEGKTCLIAYTFVLGGNEKETTYWSSHSSSRQATVEALQEPPKDPSLVVLAKNLETELDITYLNIRENMNEGKTISWFDYASSETTFDYIGKSDTDSFINIDNLLSIVDERLPPGNEHINLYGGKQQILESSLGDASSMQGGFYFLSKDLAKCISREEVRSKENIVNVHLGEDIVTGHLVDQCPEPVKRLRCVDDALWRHGLKTEDSWMKYFQEAKDRKSSSEELCHGNIPSVNL